MFATVEAPRPLVREMDVPSALVAACAGLEPGDVLDGAHPPTLAGVGLSFVIAEVSQAALRRAAPEVGAFRDALGQTGAGRMALHLYARDGGTLHARMFAPLKGIPEDPATGSANAGLAALLLSLGNEESGAWTVHQGVEIGRPSLLHASARRTPDGIRASVGGGAVPVMRGTVTV